MRKFYPVSWFQYGGYLMPGMPVVGWFQDGGGTGMPAGMPSPREMEMQALAQKIFPRQATAGSPLLSGAGKREAPKPVKQRVDSAPVGQWVRRREEVPVDPAAAVENFGMPSAEEVEREHLVKQLKEEWLKQRLPQLQRQRLQAELIDAGVPEQSARIAAIQGEKGMAENIRQRLGNYRQGFEDEREDLRRITMHPDFDPTKPIRDQAYLNDDNSFRARTLRGSNTMGSTNSGTVNFLSDAITGEGRAFANITMDAENRYWKPIEREGWRGVPTALSNAGWDVLGLLGGAAVSQRVANRLASRGLPEASAALERELLQSWRSPNVIVDNSFPGDVSEEDFLKKYLAPGSGELVEKGERDLLDNLDKGTLKELKDLFAKSMRGGEAEAHLDELFSNPDELRKFLSAMRPDMDIAFLHNKLKQLPLDELKNYFKGRKLDVGSPNEGGAPWNFGTMGSNRMRGPYSSEAMKKDPWIRDMFGGNANEVEQKKELFDFLLNPVTAQRMGGVVPAMPMIGIRRGIR